MPRSKKKKIKLEKLEIPEIEEDFKPDKWQEEVLKYNGNLALRAGRQVGKSSIIAKKAVRSACENPNFKVLVIAAAQREASFIFEKIEGELMLFKDKGKNYFAEKPTQTRIKLINGSEIRSLPTGRTGYFIRGQTLDLLIGDEAAFIPDAVWTSVIPMIAVSRKTRGFGWIWVLSTPLGAEGFFYECFQDKDFKGWHISSENCPRIDEKLLKKEKARLSKNEYLQEWCGEFIDEISRFFPSEVLNKCYYQQEEEKINPRSKYFLGVDVARYGGDENAFVVSELTIDGKVRVIKCMTTERKALTETRDKVKQLNNIYSFNRIFIDDTGIGGGLTDMLIEIYKKKIIGLNNASRSIDANKRQKKILKHDLYSNALILMEKERIEIIYDEALDLSLRSIQFHYTEEEKLKISGKYDHLAEALVRACWGTKEKILKLWLQSF